MTASGSKCVHNFGEGKLPKFVSWQKKLLCKIFFLRKIIPEEFAGLVHGVKTVRICCYSGPYFPEFELNMDIP